MARTYNPGRKKPYKNRTEVTKPEQTAEALDLMGDPLAKFEDIAEACGLPAQTTKILSERLRKRWVPVSDRIKQVRHKELLSLIEDRMMRTLDYMDDVAMASAPLRDLALTFGILHDKRQLLMGQPTQILTVQERKDLNDLLPEIVKEANRRGITIDASPVNESGEEGVSTYVHADMGPRQPKNLAPQARHVGKAGARLGLGAGKISTEKL